MRYICPQGCVAEVGMSKPHPGECSDGHGPYRYEKELKRTSSLRPVSEKRQAEDAKAGRRRRSTLKRGRSFAASDAQRGKVRLMPCLGCGRGDEGFGFQQETFVDPAHLWPRGKGGCDSPDCVIPLCRSCHDLFDRGELDLLSKLSDSEAWSVEQAHPILCHGVSVVELVRRLAGNSRELVWVEREAVSAR